MKSKILLSLKNKYKNLGLSTETLEGVADQLAVFVKEEKDIETAVAGSEGMLKSFQRFVDSRVSTFKADADKGKTELKELKDKVAALEKGKGKDPEPKGDELVNKLIEKFNSLDEKIDSLSNARKHESLSQQFQKLIGDKIPKSYYSLALEGKKFESEDDVQSFVASVEAKYEEHLQELTNSGFSQTKKPEQGEDVKDEDEIASLIDKGTEELKKE